jgi:hypothetical protein
MQFDLSRHIIACVSAAIYCDIVVESLVQVLQFCPGPSEPALYKVYP